MSRQIAAPAGWRRGAMALGLGLGLVLGLLPANDAAARSTCPPTPQTEAAMPALPTAGSAAPRTDRGMLWRISKGGHSSYLYGTIHIGKPDWAHPGPALERALRESDTLAVEVDLSDMATAGVLEAQTAHRQLILPPDLARRLARQRDAHCLPDGAIDHHHPLLQVVTLTLLSARWDGMDPAFAQEVALGHLARRQRMRIVALETAQQQLDALLPDDALTAVQMVEHGLDQLEQDRTRPALRRLARSWERGRLGDLAAYPQWCNCIHTESDRAGLRRLIDDRNPALAERIDGLHREGARVLAAVGALHMTGEHGLPALLARRGYRVERIAFAPM